MNNLIHKMAQGLFLHETYCGDKGKRFFPAFSSVYTDVESEKLSHSYNLAAMSVENPTGALGSCESEGLAHDLLKLCSIQNCVVGVSLEEFRHYGKITGHLSDDMGDNIEWFLKEGYLRKRPIEEVVVVFPTEKLLDNQKVPKRET